MDNEQTDLFNIIVSMEAEQVRDMKLRGVTMDKMLSWKKHVKSYVSLLIQYLDVSVYSLEVEKVLNFLK